MTTGDDFDRLTDDESLRIPRRRRERLVLPNWAWPLIGVACVLAGVLLGWAIWKPGAAPAPTATPPPTSTVAVAQVPTSTRPPATKVLATATPAATNTLALTATPTNTLPPTATPTDTHTPAPTATPTVALSIAVGGRVKVGDTGGANLRLRASPGLDSITFKIVPEGTILEVTGGPETAGGYTWWRLKDSVGVVGWAAEDWLIPVE